MSRERANPTNNPGRIVWVTFTRRTRDPKLRWLQRRLAAAGIQSRRQGRSFHGPILMVPEGRLEEAWALLTPELDSMPDDAPMFRKAVRS